MWLLELVRGSGYHFLIFTGLPGSGAVSLTDIERVLQCFGAYSHEGGMAHIISSADKQVVDDCYADVEGGLHRRYGFKKPGYVVVRPDGYVEYVGMLNQLSSLQSWLLKRRRMEHERGGR